MRTKTALALAVMAAGAFTASGQIYSQNIVGYVNVPVDGPSKFNLIANPLNSGANTADVVLPPVNDCQVLKWTGIGFDTWFYDDTQGGWLDANFEASIPSIPPGVGFFYYQPGASGSLTFVGEVASSPAVNTLVATSFNLVGSKLPYGGALDSASVNIPLRNDMQILKWNGATGYNTWFYDDTQGGWLNDGFEVVPAPTVDLGQGFFYYNPGTAVDWTQTLP